MPSFVASWLFQGGWVLNVESDHLQKNKNQAIKTKTTQAQQAMPMGSLGLRIRIRAPI